MRFIKLLSIVIIATLATRVATAQLTVTPVNTTNNTLNNLVQSLVGDGVLVQNIVSNMNPPYSKQPFGKFAFNGNPIGIKEGLVMATANVGTIPGNATGAPSTAITGQNNNLVVGDSLLRRSLINSGFTATCTQQLNNIVSIEFDVIPSSDSIEFSYVFASEEYPSYVCSNFNDIFGFYIQGPGIVPNQGLPANTQNIALVPGTNTPVSINNVNGGVSAGSNPNCILTNTSYFVNNQQGNSPANTVLTFNGHTVKLTARAKVIPCQVYRLIFSIANVCDQALQSGVFIEKGSLRSFGAQIEKSYAFPRFSYVVEGCNPGRLSFTRLEGNDTIPVRFEIGGTATNGVDYKVLINNDSAVVLDSSQFVALPDSLFILPNQDSVFVRIFGLKDTTYEGEEEIELAFEAVCSNDPNDSDSLVVIPLRDFFVYKGGPDWKVCTGDSTGIFNNGDSTNLYPSDIYTWYMWGPDSSLVSPPQFLSCSTCAFPQAYPDSTKYYQIFVFDPVSGCTGSDTIGVFVYSFPTVTLASDAKPVTNSICRGDDIDVWAEAFTTEGDLTYEWRPDQSIAAAFLDDSLITIKPRTTRWLQLTVTNDLGCATIDSINIIVVDPPLVEYDPYTYDLCFGDTLFLLPTKVENATKFRWNPKVGILDTAVPNAIIVPKVDTSYQIFFANDICEKSKRINVYVTDSMDVKASYVISNDSIAPCEITFNAEVFNTQNVYWIYEPSLPTDSVSRVLGNESSLIFPANEEGKYRIKLLGIDPSPLQCRDSVVTIVPVRPEEPWLPNVISPNNDDKNQTLSVKRSPPGEIEIYNRWGQPVFKSKNYIDGWNGDNLPAGVYYYHFISPKLRRTVTGWVRIER